MNRLHQVCVSELIPFNQHLVTASNKATVGEALKLLFDHDILTLPITNPDDEIIGIVNHLDILIAMISPGRSPINFLAHNITALLGITEESKVVHFCEPADRLDAILARFTDAVECYLVAKTKSQRSTILTQLDICRFFLQNLAKLQLENEMQHSISSLQLVDVDSAQDMITISTEATALEGFRLLSQHHLNAVPVLHSDGKSVCVATLSASDLRGLTIESLPNVTLDVMSFLKLTRRAHPPPAVITASPSDSFTHVLQLMVQHDIHQVWVEENNQVVGVVSTSAAIKKLRELCT